MFLFFVANPGVGKDQAIVPVRELMEDSGVVNLSPTSMTGKGMLDTLADPSIMRDFTDPETKAKVFFQSLTICVPEFGTLLSKHDLEFLSIINDAYNCGSQIRERLRSQKEDLVIRNPHVNIIAGTQPAFLSSMFPEEAWGMGFFARVIMLYHAQATKTDLFSGGLFDAKNKEKEDLKENLVKDLGYIGRMAGPMTVDNETRQALNTWHMESSEDDKPTHPKLVHYNTRRVLHLVKLCMVFAISRGSKKIQKQDLDQALQTLYEAEDRMPEIFKEMTSTGAKDIIDQAFYYILKAYNASGKKPVPEHRVIQFLVAHVPVQQIHYTLETMVRSEIIKEWKDPKSIASYDFRPGVKHPRYFIPVGMTGIDV